MVHLTAKGVMVIETVLQGHRRRRAPPPEGGPVLSVPLERLWLPDRLDTLHDSQVRAGCDHEEDLRAQ